MGQASTNHFSNSTIPIPSIYGASNKLKLHHREKWNATLTDGIAQVLLGTFLSFEILLFSFCSKKSHETPLTSLNLTLLLLEFSY